MAADPPGRDHARGADWEIAAARLRTQVRTYGPGLIARMVGEDGFGTPLLVDPSAGGAEDRVIDNFFSL